MSATAPQSAGRILFSVNAAWNVVNFRAGLIRALVAAGYDVTVAASSDAHAAGVEALGCSFVDLAMDAQGRSPLADLALFGRYVRLMREGRYDAFLGYTAKPNIYGSLAARLCGVSVINNIAGLGMIFNERGPTSRIIRALYRVALSRSAHVFFQNASDRKLFADEALVDPARTELLPGSGVDLDRFCPEALPSLASASQQTEQRFVFLLVARLLWEKGVAELVEAGHLVRARHPGAEVRLLGFVSEGKPAFVGQQDLERWEREGGTTYLGTATDVRPYLAAADCAVLPSYYPEGTPRTLLEAAAMGRPIITCDMPGCRDVVEDGANGYLVPPRDAASLAARMIDLIELGPDRRRQMGVRSREIAETRFDEQIVIARYLAVLADLPRMAHAR